jgi:YidC/Oxa1 family membrane protein insertase
MIFLLSNPLTRPFQMLLEYLNAFATSLPLPGWVSSWSVAILLVAVLIKVITQPLMSQQQASMKRMQALQPQLNDLQKRYKDDREKLSQAQMELYKAQGVNPFGGCLPLVIQMVVLFALWRAIYGLAGTTANPGVMAGARFLWIPDLSQCEPSPMCGGQFALLPVAIPFMLITMVASQMAYQHFLTPPSQSNDPQQQAMASMSKMMPLLFAYIFIKLPAGLVLYYTVFNLVGLAQVGLSRAWPRDSEQMPAIGATMVVEDAGEAVAASTKQSTKQSTKEERERDEPAVRERRRRRRKDR